MTRPGANLAKRVQFRRTRRAKKLVPGVGADPHDAGKSGFNVSKFNCATQGGKIRAEGPNDGSIAGAGLQ